MGWGREWVVVAYEWTYLWIASSVNCKRLLSMGVYLEGAYLRNFTVSVLNSTPENLANVLKDFLWLKSTLEKLLRSRYFPGNFWESPRNLYLMKSMPWTFNNESSHHIETSQFMETLVVKKFKWLFNSFFRVCWGPWFLSVFSKF